MKYSDGSDDYPVAQGGDWNDAGMGVSSQPDPPAADYKAAPTDGAAKGAAAGSAAGPWGAVIGAVAGLLTQQKAAKEAARVNQLNWQEANRQRELQNVQRYQENQINTAGQMGNREQSAINQLLGVFARSQYR